MGDSLAGQLSAVLDIGKTNAKLHLADNASGELLWSVERANESLAVHAFRELDIAGLELWLLEALRALPDKERISAIVPVAHGATAVLLDADGALLCAPDYEDAIYEATTVRYEQERDRFERSWSPLLPQGLNLARQWQYLKDRRPDMHQRVECALLYPQYWSWWLSGVAASEVTSLGCHTDLWRPTEGRCSEFARRAGWDHWLPPLQAADARLGRIRPDLAARTGLAADCSVLCGIHDSNAAYLCHRAARATAAPFAVISSGTWTIILSHGSPLARLRPDRDMLANVDAWGEVTPTARFMGGREFLAIAGDAAAAATPTLEDLQAVFAQGALALPSFAPAGPYAGREGHIVDAERLDDAAHAALASLYVALMCELRLDELAAQGDLIVDGPLASNALYCEILAALRPAQRVALADPRAGVVHGALQLVRGRNRGGPAPAARVVAPRDITGLDAYRARWRRQLDHIPIH